MLELRSSRYSRIRRGSGAPLLPAAPAHRHQWRGWFGSFFRKHRQLVLLKTGAASWRVSSDQLADRNGGYLESAGRDPPTAHHSGAATRPHRSGCLPTPIAPYRQPHLHSCSSGSSSISCNMGEKTCMCKRRGAVSARISLLRRSGNFRKGISRFPFQSVPELLHKSGRSVEGRGSQCMRVVPGSSTSWRTWNRRSRRRAQPGERSTCRYPNLRSRPASGTPGR